MPRREREKYYNVTNQNFISLFFRPMFIYIYLDNKLFFLLFTCYKIIEISKNVFFSRREIRRRRKISK